MPASGAGPRSVTSIMTTATLTTTTIRLPCLLLPLLLMGCYFCCCCCHSAPEGHDGVELAVTWGTGVANTSDEALWEWLRDAVRRDSAASGPPQPEDVGDDGDTVVSRVQSGAPYNGGYFTVIMGVGTPAQRVLLSIDTASALSWVQCQQCTACYDPRRSATTANVTCADPMCALATPDADNPGGCRGLPQHARCTFNTQYADGSISRGDILSDAVSFGSITAGHVYLGCGDAASGLTTGAVGMIGLGRGPTNAALKWGGRMFYRLPDYSGGGGSTAPRGVLCLGRRCRTPHGSVVSRFMATPFPSAMYSIRLTRMTVGSTYVALSGSGDHMQPAAVTVIQTGTFITRLVPSVYTAVRDAFVAQTAPHVKRAPPQDILDTCFDVDVAHMGGGGGGLFPAVKLHIGGAGDVSLSPNAVLAALGPRLACLAFAPSDDQSLNVLGGFQQQGLLVSFDLYTNKIAFLPSPGY